MTSPSISEPAPKPGRRNALLDRLYAEFPVFRDYQPLAIGIHRALKERFPDVGKGQVWAAMQHHTGTTRYLKALVDGAPRFDLDGKPSGAVTAEQQNQAADTLRDRFRKVAERRKAEQEALQRQEKLQQLAQKFNPR